MSDLISRQKVLSTLDFADKALTDEVRTVENFKAILMECIEVLPSAVNKGDLISRQAVENITWEEPSYSDPLNVLTEVREKVRALPSVENKGEWIPVSEKLPSDCGHDWVLAQIQEDNGYLWIPCVAEYRKFFDDWFTEANEVGWLSRHKGAFKVVAWQPLPEPYNADMRGEADEKT